MSKDVAFTAVVLAADRVLPDPVARAAGVCCKALSPVAGAPMVWRVLEALEASQEVNTRILCGPPRSALEENSDLLMALATGRFSWVQNRATPSSSAAAAMRSIPEATPVLLTTADHALLSSEMVDYFCAQARATGYDIVVALASGEKLASTYPELRRTVLKFRDGAYCSCNLFAFITAKGRTAANYWRRVEHQRKRPWCLMTEVGWTVVLRYLLGRVSLDEGLKRISQRLGLRAGVVIMPFLEAAVDVDSVKDWIFAEKLARAGTICIGKG